MDGLVAPAAGTNPQLGLHSSEGFGLQGSLTDAAGYTAQQARSVEARQVGRAYQQRRVSGRGGGGEREGAGRRVLGLGGGSWGREEEEVGGDLIKPPWVGEADKAGKERSGGKGEEGGVHDSDRRGPRSMG